MGMVKSAWRGKDSATPAGSWLLIIKASSPAPELISSVSSYFPLQGLKSPNATANTLPRRSCDVWIHNGFKDISMFCCQPEVWIREPTRKEWMNTGSCQQSRACALSHLVSEPRREMLQEIQAKRRSWDIQQDRRGKKQRTGRTGWEATPSRGSRRQRGGMAKPWDAAPARGGVRPFSTGPRVDSRLVSQTDVHQRTSPCRGQHFSPKVQLGCSDAHLGDLWDANLETTCPSIHLWNEPKASQRHKPY